MEGAGEMINYQIDFIGLTRVQARQLSRLIEDFKNDNKLHATGVQGIEPGQNGTTHILSYGNTK